MVSGFRDKLLWFEGLGLGCGKTISRHTSQYYPATPAALCNYRTCEARSCRRKTPHDRDWFILQYGRYKSCNYSMLTFIHLCRAFKVGFSVFKCHSPNTLSWIPILTGNSLKLNPGPYFRQRRICHITMHPQARPFSQVRGRIVRCQNERFPYAPLYPDTMFEVSSSYVLGWKQLQRAPGLCNSSPS